jgi:PPIC-type PPIASE domain
MMSRLLRPFVLVGVLVLGAGVLAGCGSTASDAATITYHDSSGAHTIHITKSELLEQIRQLQDTKPFRALLAQSQPPLASATGSDTAYASLTARWLAQLVDQTVVDAEFKSQGLQVSGAQTAAARADLEQRYSKAAFDAFPKSLQDRLLTGDAHLDAVLTSCASGRLVAHILLRSEQDAIALLNQLKNGADFAALAKQKSIDAQSGQAGGVLGCLYTGEFVAPFQSAAESVPFDTVTAPVHTQFGYHLILVRRWDPRAAASDQNLSQSVQQAATAALDARLNALHVWINPLYGSWTEQTSSSGQKAFTVVAPPVPAPRDQREKPPAVLTPSP